MQGGEKKKPGPKPKTPIVKKKKPLTSAQKKKVVSDKQSGKTVTLPNMLDAATMAASGLKLETIDSSGATPKYIYCHVSSSSSKKAPAKASKACVGKSCKKDDDSDDESSDDDEPADVEMITERLKKCRRETLVMICEDFGVKSTGNKNMLAEICAEQVCYETDSDSDSGSESDDDDK